MPIPASEDLALWGFLREMKRSEGAADLKFKQELPDHRGLQFEAVGKLYHVRGILRVSGWTGWVTYAGTRVGQTFDLKELAKAEEARDSTVFGELRERP
jgi:hypothetical protein